MASCGRSSIRRERKPPAQLEERKSAIASGSIRQPSASAARAPDSTMPRSTAEAMNGHPSARAMISSTAVSGSGPAIDSTNCRTSSGSKCESRKWSAGRLRRST